MRTPMQLRQLPPRRRLRQLPRHLHRRHRLHHLHHHKDKG